MVPFTKRDGASNRVEDHNFAKHGTSQIFRKICCHPAKPLRLPLQNGVRSSFAGTQMLSGVNRDSVPDDRPLAEKRGIRRIEGQPEKEVRTQSKNCEPPTDCGRRPRSASRPLGWMPLTTISLWYFLGAPREFAQVKLAISGPDRPWPREQRRWGRRNWCRWP
jgi:hypothetical protein